MQWDDIPPVVNYLMVRAPDHPLADHNGAVLLHRWLVYQRIGPGPHPCHWCGVPLDWTDTRRPGGLVVDHVDGNPGNNEDANLVPSCNRCNTLKRRDRILDSELTILSGGARTRAAELTCIQCKSVFKVKLSRAKTAQFCSRRCNAKVIDRTGERPWQRVRDDELFIERTDRHGQPVRFRASYTTCELCSKSFLAENVRVRKGTVRFCSNSCSGKANGDHGNQRRGEACRQTELTESDVREIRRLWATGRVTLVALGAQFGLTKSGANAITHGRSWKHVV